MIVSDLMTKKIVSVQPETSLADAARIMLDQDLSGLPVLNAAGRLVGIVTEGDLLRRVEIGTAELKANWMQAFFLPDRLATDYVKTHGRHVAEVMTAEPVTVTPQTALSTAASIMRDKKIKRLPVVEGEQLVGMLGRTDILGALVRKLIELDASHPTDGEIYDYIKAVLAKENWAPRAGLHIEVHDGVVFLKGIIMSDAEKQALTVIAENAPGVKKVTDELVFVDPATGMAFQ